MACRCQERRDAIRRAVALKTVEAVKKEVGFIVRTASEDLLKAVNIRRTPSKG